MSSFFCDKCGKAIIDTDYGYITGCEHYEPDIYPCFNRKCPYYDDSMMDNCSKGDPPNTKECPNFISFEVKNEKDNEDR